MKYLKDQAYVDADSGDDLAEPLAVVEGRAEALRERLAELSSGDARGRAEVLLELGRAFLALGRRKEAWDAAREAFDLCLGREDWEGAVQCCDVLFAADQPQSLAALGQGIWLAVTYPIDPELSVAMLQHVIHETPSDADGAAVAAVVAHYLVDLRAPEGKERDNLLFYTNQLLATVARRHSEVYTQEAFDAWFRRLELDDPAKFLPRLRKIVDVLVQDDWWFDPKALQARLPVQ